MAGETHHCAGFDLGGTLLKYGIVDGNGGVIHQGAAANPQDIASLAALIKDIWRKLTADHGPIHSAGFGVPGTLSRTRQRIVQSPHCRILEGLDLPTELTPHMECPIVFENEANLAAYGEYRVGAASGNRSLVLLTVGSGIGTGIILEGQIWRGEDGFAGELGHVSLDPAGRACRCGNRGCLETEVSAPRIVELYRQLSRDRSDLTAADVCRRAESGDRQAEKAFAQAGHYLGIGIALSISLLNPTSVLLGGGVLDAGELILKPARESARRHSHRPAFAACSIRPAALGNRAGFIGAALYGREHLKDRGIHRF